MRKFVSVLFVVLFCSLIGTFSQRASAQQFADSVKWRIWLMAVDSSVSEPPARAYFAFHPDANYGPPNDILTGFSDRWFENSTPSDTEREWPPVPPGTFLDFNNVRPPLLSTYQLTMIHPCTDTTLIDTFRLGWFSDGFSNASTAPQVLTWPSPQVLKYYADSIILSYSSGGTTYLHADLTKDSMYTYDLHKDTLADGSPIPTNSLHLAVYHPKPAPLPPGVVLAARPLNGATGFSGSDTLAWQDVPVLDGLPVMYRVQLSTDRNFGPGTIILQDSIAGDWIPYSGLHDQTWYYWRVKAFTPFGVGIYSATPDSFQVSVLGVKKERPGVPKEFALHQNYPNPFNPTTTIAFDIPKTGFTEIAVYNTIGQKISTLAATQLNPGSYTVQWDARNSGGTPVPSGVYLVRMSVRGLAGLDFTAVRKLMFIK